jgi:hypothetical protein
MLYGGFQMKRFAKTLMLLTTIIMVLCISIPVQAAPTTYRVTVKYQAVSLVYNNHVGNEWSKIVKYNGKNVSLGSSLAKQLKNTDKMVITCTATEKDKYPDIGSVTISLNVANLKKGTTTFVKNVIVTENRGRYSGNKACWKFTIVVNKK